MKKHLSLILVFAFMLSMIPMSVSADVTTAELKSVTVTGATLIPSLTSGTYTYDVIVDDKEALLPQLNYTLNDNTASYEVLKSADYLGDYTLVKVTDGQAENTYKFTYRAPYEVSVDKGFSQLVSAITKVNPSSGNSAWTTTSWFPLNKNSTGISTSSWTSLPLIRFDLSSVTGDTNGKFTLTVKFYNKRNYAGKVQLRELTTLNDTWTGTTATFNNTLNGISNPVGAEVIDTVSASGLATNGALVFDVSDFVRTKLAQEKKVLTFTLDVPDDNVDDLIAVIQTNLSTSGAVIDYYPVVKSSVATLKSVEIKDALVLDAFAETKYEYNIGVKEGETPSFKYILNNSHANAVVSTENNKTTITVTAQDGVETKTYTFNHKTYEEMGVSETAEIAVTDASFTENNGTADLNVSLNNLNVNKKKLTFVTLTKKDGVLVGSSVNSVTKEYATGSYNDELCATVTLPNDINGVTVEAYIYDTTDANNKKAVYEKVVFGGEYAHTPVISDTDKSIAIMADDSKPGNVIVYGKGEPNQYVTFFVAHPDKTLAEFTLAELNVNAAVIDMAKANSDGIWEKSVTFPDVAGNYVAYLDAQTLSESFLHASFAQKKIEIEKVYEEIYKDQDKETAVVNIKLQLGMKDDNNITDLILGIDTSCFDTLKEEDVIEALYGLVKEAYNVKPTVSTDDDVTTFIETYNKAVVIAKLNNGTSISVSDLISTFAFSDSAFLTTLLSKINPASHQVVSNAVVNGSISSAKLTNASDLDDRIRRAILFTSINYPENTAGAQDIIDTYGAYLTLDMSNYNNVLDKANLVSELVNKGPFASIGILNTELNNLSIAYLNAVILPPPPVGGVGGGAARPSSPVITPAQGTGVTGTGALHTDDFKTEQGKYFGDVENDHWAYTSTKYLNEKGILKGMDNGNFEPNRSIKREEFAKILVLAFNLQAKDEDKLFTDVKDTEWYYEYVKIAAQNGIINGIGDGVFGAGYELSRQDIAVMIARVLNKNEVSEENFADDTEISSYAKDAVYTLKNLGVLNGTGNGNFEPKRSVTRAECAKIVYELIKE